MLLWCHECKARHIDKGKFATKRRTHACQKCGMVWRPIVPTVGVQFLSTVQGPRRWLTTATFGR